jgi:hypothetical protein
MWSVGLRPQVQCRQGLLRARASEGGAREKVNEQDGQRGDDEQHA